MAADRVPHEADRGTGQRIAAAGQRPGKKGIQAHGLPEAETVVRYRSATIARADDTGGCRSIERGAYDTAERAMRGRSGSRGRC
jgi:hypothetical protein